MALPWIRQDTALPHNDKILALIREKDGWRAAFVFVCSKSLCGAQGADGFISREQLPFIHGTDRTAELLVKHDLWAPVPGGWLIPDWADEQLSGPEQQDRSKRAQAAALVRWAGHQAMTDAERAKNYRDRKKAERSNGPPDAEIVTSRHDAASR